MSWCVLPPKKNIPNMFETSRMKIATMLYIKSKYLNSFATYVIVCCTKKINKTVKTKMCSALTFR